MLWRKAASDVKKHGRFITGWVEGTLREQFKDISIRRFELWISILMSVQRYF